MGNPFLKHLPGDRWGLAARHEPKHCSQSFPAPLLRCALRVRLGKGHVAPGSWTRLGPLKATWGSTQMGERPGCPHSHSDSETLGGSIWPRVLPSSWPPEDSKRNWRLNQEPPPGSKQLCKAPCHPPASTLNCLLLSHANRFQETLL